MFFLVLTFLNPADLVRGFVFRQEELSIADQKQQVIHNYSQRKHVLLQGLNNKILILFNDILFFEELRSYEQNSNSIVDNGMSECSTVPSGWDSIAQHFYS